jgi:site-specific DNA-methyltransferase (adenine-specific)
LKQKSSILDDVRLFHRYRSKALHGELYLGDATNFLRSLKTSSAHLVFLDPPFNLGKKYVQGESKHDRRPVTEYVEWMRIILSECVRILADGGALYLYHLPAWAMRLGASVQDQLQFRHWIAISMKNGFVRGQHLYPAHYALLYFTKGQPTTFIRPKLSPAVCRHCGGTIKDYGGYRSIIEAKGINLSDVWDDISPVRHSNRKHRTENELPLTLTRRVVEISGRAGQVFVDPFAGSGSAVIAAVEQGMTFKACDIVEANCTVIDTRLANL